MDRPESNDLAVCRISWAALVPPEGEVMRGLAIATLFLGLCLLKEDRGDAVASWRLSVFVIAAIAILMGI